MDLGRFFGDLFSGKLFSQKKEEEKQRQQQVTVQKPSTLPTLNIPNQTQGTTLRMPEPFTPPQASLPQLGGVKVAEAPKPVVKPPTVVSAPKPVSLDLNVADRPKSAMLDLTVRPSIGPRTPQPEEEDRPFLEKLGAGFQQAGGRVLDTLVQGGGLLTQLGNLTNPFINEERRNQKIQEDVAASEFLRGKVNEMKDISGNAIVGNRDVDEAATRIATGQGTAQDFAAVGGRGLDVAGTTTMFINPARTLQGAAVGIQPIRSLLPVVGREAGLYGGLEGTQASLDTYGQTGDLAQAAGAFLPNAALGAGSQLGLEALAYGTGRAIRGVAGRTPLVRSLERAGEDAVDFAEETSQPFDVNRGIETPNRPSEPLTPRDPTSPITESPTTNKAPAITSPNRPDPTIQPQQPIFQPPVDNTPTVPQGIEAQAPTTPRLIDDPFMTPDEATTATQKAIDDAAVESVVEPAPADVTTVETPLTTQSKVVAETATPISNEAVAADVAQTKRAQETQYASPVKGGKAGVPGNAKVSYNTGDNMLDAIVNDSIIATRGTANTAGARLEALEKAGISTEKQKRIRDLATKNVDKQTGRVSLEAQQKIREIIAGTDEAPTVGARRSENTSQEAPESEPSGAADEIDPRVARSNSEADELISRANKSLEGESSSYAQVVRKLYNNNAGKPQSLTAAERRVASEIQPKLDRVLAKMNELGLTDADMGAIADYLPTTKLDELNSVRNVRDIEGHDFGFTKTRGNKLTDAEIEEGAEQALKNYLGTGELLDDLTTETVSKIKLARRDKEFIDLIEQDGKGGSTGLSLDDAEIQNARKVNETLIKSETDLSTARKRVQSGDESPEAISELNRAEKAANDAYIEKQVEDYITLERKTDEAIADIRSSNELTTETKKQRISQLENHLTDVRNQTYYMQSTVRTNLLFGVGRIADQVNKGIQSTSDKITAGSRLGANSSFRNQTGRNLYGDNKTVGAVWDAVKNNPALNQAKTNTKIAETILRRQDANKGVGSKAFGAWRMAGTRLTEAGSRYKIAAKDTVSFFTEKAKAEGLTDVKDIANYVENQIGSAEWKRVHTALFEARNTFTGLPTAGKVASRDLRFNVRNAIYNKLGSIPGISRSMRENIADGVTIPVVGFPRLIYRLGVRGLDNATWGVGDFIKAATIKPKTEADALRKALLVQQGFRSAQNGATLGAIGVMLGASGMTTGAYPEDSSEKSRWETDRIQPFSLKLGDQYIDVGRYAGPLAFPLMIGAAIGRGNPQDIPGTVGELTQQFLANYGADSMGDILETAGGLLKGDWEGTGKDLNRIGAGIASSFAPASSLANTAGKAQDMITGSAAPDGSANIVDAIRSRFPIFRSGLPEKTDSLGNPISQGTALNLLPGVSGGQSTAPAKNDTTEASVKSEIDRLAGLDFEVMPSRDVENTNSQVDAKLLMGSNLYKNSDDEKKAEYLKEALLGSKTKDINKSLSDTDRSALIEHKLQNENQRKVWLEDNDNAFNYYTGNYNNKKANGELTSDDDNLQNKSGAKYKMIEAKVDKEFKADSALKQLYDDITEAEWREMIDGDGVDDDMEAAQRLYAYDQARTKAGVSGKDKNSSKPKYTQKAGGSGRGGRGSKSFAFANLPSSLIGTGSGGTGKGGGYADAAPTFKPIADLKAPTEANIPKGRTISVKKGISL